MYFAQWTLVGRFRYVAAHSSDAPFSFRTQNSAENVDKMLPFPRSLLIVDYAGRVTKPV
jgi:hypothetical protein